MGKLTLILGGARSGKSTQAEKLAIQRGKQVLYVATAIPFDEEMKRRIRNHQEQRPKSWVTVETPAFIAESIQDQMNMCDVVLLDCMTLLVNNLFMKFPGNSDSLDEGQISMALDREIDGILNIIETFCADWIIVSNEVGLGLVPPYPMGRVYRDILGRANQRLAANAEAVYLMVAGMAIPLHEINDPLLE
jgi:adenosylcobinamide kinase/adenosylcobinamide-phosphate guanylyltransferase